MILLFFFSFRAHAHSTSGAERGLAVIVVAFFGQIILLPFLITNLILFLRKRPVASKFFGAAVPIISIVIAGGILLLCSLVTLISGVNYINEGIIIGILSKEQLLGFSLAIVFLSIVNLRLRKKQIHRSQRRLVWLKGFTILILSLVSGPVIQRLSYELRTFNASQRFDEYSHSGQDIAFGPNGDTLVSIDSRWTPSTKNRKLLASIRIWNLQGWRAKLIRSYDVKVGKTGNLRSVWVSKTGKHIITADKTGGISIRDFETGKLIKSYPFSNQKYATVDYCQSSHSAVRSSKNGPIQLINLTNFSKKELSVERQSFDDILVSVCSPNSQFVAVSLSNNITIIETKTGNTVGKIKANSRRRLAFSPDHSMVAGVEQNYTSNKSKIRLWSIPNGSLVREIVHGRVINDLSFSPDGKQIAISSRGQVSLYSTTTGQQTHELVHLPNSKASIELSNDGKLLATGWDKLKPSILLFPL